MSTVKKPGFHVALARLVEVHGSVEQYKKLWAEHFTDEPTQAHIDAFKKSINNEDHDGGDDSYDESYDPSYSY